MSQAKIQAIIVDDEEHGRINLMSLLEKNVTDIHVTGMADSVDNAEKLIIEVEPDLVFLDIQMPGGNGFELLKRIKDYNFEVIFVTAFDEYAIQAIRFSASDYLLKPINYKELLVAVEKVKNQLALKKENNRLKELMSNLKNPGKQRIGLPDGRTIRYVEVNHIIHCKGEGNYTTLVFDNQKPLLVSKTLVEFQELLQEHAFIRTHKTHLVNLKHVVVFEMEQGDFLVLSNGDKVAVSRRRKEVVKANLSRKG